MSCLQLFQYLAHLVLSIDRTHAGEDLTRAPLYYDVDVSTVRLDALENCKFLDFSKPLLFAKFSAFSDDTLQLHRLAFKERFVKDSDVIGNIIGEVGVLSSSNFVITSALYKVGLKFCTTNILTNIKCMGHYSNGQDCAIEKDCVGMSSMTKEIFWLPLLLRIKIFLFKLFRVPRSSGS